MVRFVTLNKASRWGVFAGLLGAGFTTLLIGFVQFSASYDGNYSSGRWSLYMLLLPCLFGIASGFISSEKPLAIGIVLTVAALSGFYLLGSLWVVPGLMMFIGAVIAFRALGQPALLQIKGNANVGLGVVGCLGGLVFGIGLLILILGGSHTGAIFTRVNTPTAPVSRSATPAFTKTTPSTAKVAPTR